MRRLILVALAAFFCGCAYTLVEDGQIRSGELRRMLARTAATRGLPLPDHLQTRVVQRQDLPELLRQLFRDEWHEAELRDTEETLTTIGLWPGGLDLLSETIRIEGGEMAGLYSPTRRTLYLVEGVEVPEIVATASAVSGRDLYTEFVLSHEIVHALQHEAFPQLFDVTSQWKDQDDAVLALHAAIEGDALRYGLEVITPDAQLPPSDLLVQVQDVEGTMQGLSEAPALLRYSLLFPYVSGYSMALAEGKHLLVSPPVSTEQALHADKRRDDFWSISLEALQRGLPSGCVAIGENTMGEFLISVFLRDLGSDTPPRAWEGWNGDRYLVARCGDSHEFVWATSWDSETDAREFQAAYSSVAAAVSARAQLEAPPQSKRSGTEVVVFTAGLAALAERVERDAVRSRIANLADLVTVRDRRDEGRMQ